AAPRVRAGRALRAASPAGRTRGDRRRARAPARRARVPRRRRSPPCVDRAPGAERLRRRRGGGGPVSSAWTHCLREVTVLDESGSFAGPVDVLVEDGRIAKVGKALGAPDVASSDFSGL